MEHHCDKVAATEHKCEHDHAGHVCGGCSSYGVAQSLDELAFERGIWGAAFNGELQKVQLLLEQGRSCNSVDSSGYSALVRIVFSSYYSLLVIVDRLMFTVTVQYWSLLSL